MRILAFLFFLFFLLFAIVARWYYVCELRQLCGEEPVVVEDIRLRTLQLTEGDSVLLSGYDQFAFDSAGYQARLNDDNDAFLDTLATLLKADSTKKLTITGFYSEKEVDVMADFFENLGLARADHVRFLLMHRGIDEDRIDLDHGITADSLLQEPLSFAFYTSGTPSEYSTTAYTFTNMTYSDANFKFDSDEFEPGGPCQMYADSVSQYLAINPESTLTIIGHTDNIGATDYNADLGLRRAKSAREYFLNLGIDNEILVESRGEKEPVASNSSAGNRQKNRRVNFVIE